MRYNYKNRKYIALMMLFVFGINLLLPTAVFALTSGPSQPETKGFQPASVADMVDLQSGSLKYNIPLIDIDGYPINLNYQSGSGIEDEASWVGLGWSLNPGAINRQVRGLPDDYLKEEVETDHYTKPKVTVGGRLTTKFELFGNAKGGLTFGIFSDNYTGIGAEIGANAGISFSFTNGGKLTAGMGAGILSNTQSGAEASVSPYLSLAIKETVDHKMLKSANFSGAIGYNSRAGMKTLSFGANFTDYTLSYNVFGTNLSYNTEPISPDIQIPYKTTYGSFSLDVGTEVLGGFPSVGGTGYQNVRAIQKFAQVKHGYGFLYAERGKNDPDAVMDFIREKDNPIIPTIPNLAIPIHTPDVWSYSSQTGSGQFRLYRGGSGVFFDNEAEEQSSISTTGGDFGVGGWFHGGITRYEQNSQNVSRKWTGNNNYLAKGDFQNESFVSANDQHVYFKKVGDAGLEDEEIAAQTDGINPVAVSIAGVSADATFNKKVGKMAIGTPLRKTTRRPNSTVISYLTAKEAAVAGLERNIRKYPMTEVASSYNLPAYPTYDTLSRVDVDHKAAHISELTVTDGGGKRMVYGIPVYNLSQDEYTFAVGSAYSIASGSKAQVATPAVMASNPQTNTLGIDNYYHREKKQPYATSYLLTGILSADYADKTGNGITPDDMGTAIKFNYSKSPVKYNWRTPYKNATLNKALMADLEDDKGSVVYGQKELWYISSIESKTKIAYFITENRKDALGVNANWQTGDKDATQTQRCLREIRLYSRADMSRPIKVVKFNYTYELNKGITGYFLPNSTESGNASYLLGGKLTLSKVWFEYGNSTKGANHPYKFKYIRGLNTAASDTLSPAYRDLSSDRWGNFKRWDENSNGANNDIYPYTTQTKTTADANASLSQLSSISLPTGGTINISYESGDYAYVQDKKATVMTGVTALIDGAGNAVTALNSATGIKFDMGTTAPGTLATPADRLAWFKNTVLNGSDYLYTKLYVQLSTKNCNTGGQLLYDYVPCYCKVSGVTFTGQTANVQFTSVQESGVTTNPVSLAAWQKMKSEYPKYAYPGFDNRVKSANNSFSAAVAAIISAAKNLSELQKNFYQKANGKGYASAVNTGLSFVRIVKANGIKLGGAVRVKKIQINDNWTDLSEVTAATNGIYGQAYSYTTTTGISSGVATYEPAIGSDENPLKQPIFYSEKIKGAIDNYFNLEMPFCESLYPAPAVGYSRVQVNDLDRNGSASTETGYTVTEFFTAKDFPVQVTALPILPQPGKKSTSYGLMRSNSVEETGYSQGYSIELNDMHGKVRSSKIYDKAGVELSSTVYEYFADDNNSFKTLNNNVNIVDPVDLKLKKKYLGRDIEFFTDMREELSSNKGRAINIGGDVIAAVFIPLTFLHKPVGGNDDYKLFRSACALKVVQNYGILSKVIKTQNGSSITTQNMAFDALTGEAIVTKTQNEFGKDIYSVNIPAYWAYKGMGAAYKNLGVSFRVMATNTYGEVLNYGSFLYAGDEIADVNTGTHYWVIDNQAGAGGSATTKKLITRDGQLAKSKLMLLVKVVRSGYRNMLGDDLTKLVCLNNPFDATNTLKLVSSGDLTALKVINASASTYDENWTGGNICALKQIGVLQVDTTNLVENTTRNFSVSAMTHPGTSLTLIQQAGTTSPDSTVFLYSSPYWGSASNPGRSGIISFWPTAAATLDSTNVNNSYYSFEVIVNFPVSKKYFFATSASDKIEYGLDCGGWGGASTASLRAETQISDRYVTAGNHLLTVSIRLFNNKKAYANRVAGFEIYDNTYTELKNANASGTGLKRLFSTQNFVGKSNIYSYFSAFSLQGNQNSVYHYRKSDGTPPFYNTGFCPISGPPQYATVVVNPYTTGLLGNWRPYQTKVFQTNRQYSYENNLKQQGIEVKNAGYLNGFVPNWSYDTTSTAWVRNTTSTKWVTANTVTLYDKYGQQLENLDALNRYSAAKFDFNGELPSAVASNAMNREIYTATLEDNRFTIGGAGNTDTCNVREFKTVSGGQTIKQVATGTVSHSGNYSVQLNSSGLTLATVTHNLKHKTVPYYKLDVSRQYITRDSTGLYPNGFEPSPGKKYIFNAWVQDTHPEDNTLGLTLNRNGTNVPLTCKANVEGWKLVEGVIDLTSFGSAALNINILPVSGESVYLDDIRIHPADAQMKTFAYDDKTMRLMAEIDENGFATFYEYDDEGLLIRVKKETEKGIMTIKESRSSYKKAL